MRDLHVVALSEDGRHVVLATTEDAKRGGFRVALDDRLQAAVKGELTRGGRAPSETMSVREIQARLRAGASVEDLARAGVPLARVERFAGPVLSEREQVVAQARKAVLVRGRRGPSALPLGEAVDLRLSELPSMRADSVVWTAWKGEDGLWTVEVSWFSRGRTRTAQWRYDLAARTVVSVDPGSASLGHVDAEGRAADGEPTPPRPARTGARSKGGRASTAAAAGPASASDRPRGTGTGRPGGEPDLDDDDADVDVEADDEPGTASRASGARGPRAKAAPRGRAAGAPRARTARGAAASGAAARGTAALGAAARGTAARGAPPAGTAARSTAASGTDSSGATTPRRPAAPAIRVTGGVAPGAARTAGGAAGAERPAALRPPPAPFGPAAVAAVRRPPAAARPAAPPRGAAAPAPGPVRAARGTAARAPEPPASAPPRVLAGDTGLVVPAPGRRPEGDPRADRHERADHREQTEAARGVRAARSAQAARTVQPARAVQPGRPVQPGTVQPERPSELERPSGLERPAGPPSLRVVPRPADDVDDEPAADVS